MNFKVTLLHINLFWVTLVLIGRYSIGRINRYRMTHHKIDFFFKGYALQSCLYIYSHSITLAHFSPNKNFRFYKKVAEQHIEYILIFPYLPPTFIFIHIRNSFFHSSFPFGKQLYNFLFYMRQQNLVFLVLAQFFYIISNVLLSKFYYV